MARRVISLTDTEIKKTKPRDKEYKLFDGGGLYLAVTLKGQKYWRLKYRFEDKEYRLSLGVYPTISLKDAREQREQLKRDIAKGINPSVERKVNKEALQTEQIQIENTFEKIARERLLKVQETISEAHYKRTLTALVNDAFPFIGNKAIDEVTAPDIVSLLHKMDERGVRESARKLFYSISKTFK